MILLSMDQDGTGCVSHCLFWKDRLNPHRLRALISSREMSLPWNGAMVSGAEFVAPRKNIMLRRI